MPTVDRIRRDLSRILNEWVDDVIELIVNGTIPNTDEEIQLAIEEAISENAAALIPMLTDWVAYELNAKFSDFNKEERP